MCKRENERDRERQRETETVRDIQTHTYNRHTHTTDTHTHTHRGRCASEKRGWNPKNNLCDLNTTTHTSRNSIDISFDACPS